jgi:hypothetical protein
MDKEMLDTLRSVFKDELRVELEPIKADIKEIKVDIKSFRDQFTDFEGKSAGNHVEVLNNIENM